VVKVVLIHQMNVRRSLLPRQRNLLDGINATFPIILQLMRAPVPENHQVGPGVELLLEHCAVVSK
jgi:hypothetical protein